MKLLENIGGSAVRKAALTVLLMGGFLAFVGTGTASAHPRVFVGVGIGEYYAPYYSPYYYGPVYGPAYVGPRYRYYYGPRYEHYYGHRYYGPRYRSWDERYHCWRYR